ncbi:hypothetical protein OG394_04920 [Kribbella sp. NBC_01245]|uniref:hypothetical protein n=1 Tax=Kribbella sp. NBC_01245 TaxID=2903578 RepID=UPI002E292C5B|nr:hypothetical protein [Kribbella sp. NBC_01245]
MSRISRLATIALLTGATALTAGAQPASAATTDAGWCHGEAVSTCIKLEVDGGNVRALATIRDVAGGTDFGVDVRWVKLQMYNRAVGRWVDVAVTTEEKFEYTYDVAATGWRTCAGQGGVAQFRAAGWYKWRNPSGAVFFDEMTTAAHGVPCAP